MVSRRNEKNCPSVIIKYSLLSRDLIYIYGAIISCRLVTIFPLLQDRVLSFQKSLKDLDPSKRHFGLPEKKHYVAELDNKC